MFGKNKLAKVLKDDGSYLEVQEIFHTIQGEGPFAGVPAVFIRLAGCHLHCVFCDTDFESKTTRILASEVSRLSVELSHKDVVNPTRLFVITGGEPLRQNIAPLCESLLGSNEENVVQIETAGNIWQGSLDKLFLHTGTLHNMSDSPRMYLVCSPKTPAVHDMVYKLCRDWKYIIVEGGYDFETGIPNFNSQTGQPTGNMVYHPQLEGEDAIWLQPCEEYKTVAGVQVKDVEKTQSNINAAVSLAKRFNYRLSLQLHKILNLP